jgi:glycosyltransferase involved in cell wall biosynthesis
MPHPVLTHAPLRLTPEAAIHTVRAPATRVLVDLSHAAEGYVGVAQDLRLIFSMLCGLNSVDPSGLLMPTNRHSLPRVGPGEPHEAALTASVLHCMERNFPTPPRRPFPLSMLQKSRTLRGFLRNRHDLLPVSDPGQMNALWRILFAKTLPPAQRERVLARRYFATDLSVSSIIDRCAVHAMPGAKQLQAEQFDAVLFGMPRPVRLPAGVRQIIRFHDSVPVTDMDTVTHWRVSLLHSQLVRRCAPDALFVCNSPQSRESLLTLDPSRARHALVIPCAVAPPPRSSAGISPHAVVARHIVFRALGRHDLVVPDEWSPPRPGFRYVLSVSTLEPRKNFSGLVRAWERVAARTDPDLKLVIVGGPGWRESAALSEMRPDVASGRILHVHDLPPDELHALMRGAACFAFPSFNEGFGYSPVEALQAGAPCVVSDLPVFRWVFGDTAIFVDPYDVDSIAAGIERVLCPETGPALTRSLREAAEPVLARFRPGHVAEGWENLFHRVRAEA